jgi:HK97 family phage prohead protease
MPSELFEYKSTSLGNSLSSKGGNINLDEAQGIVECFVAGIGNKDSVGDIVASGAFSKSLQRRKPRVVWGHSWNDPIGKVLEIYEVPNTDNRLPLKMKMAGIGGLFARVQFNLNSEKGREAFAMVAFFGEEQEWSIGYKTLRAQFDQKSQANVIYELELYEVSPVLHGANQLTGTISVKSDDNASGVMMAMMEDDEDAIDKAEIEKQLAAILGAKVSLMDVNGDELTFARRMDNGEVGRYKCGFSGSRGRYMFGPPQQIVVMPTRKPVAPMQNMPMMAPGVPANEPQRVIRPSQMPAMPIAIKPGENGNRMVPLPPVQYEDMDNDRNQPEFDKNNLDQEEADLRDALLKIVKRHGRFNEDSDGVWAGYKPAAENPVAAIGVKCANCVFYQGGNSCKIIAMDVEPEGKCRFAVIPKGVVTGDTASKKTYELDEEFNEEDYIADLEVKYPGELAVAALRGIIKRRRKKRRKFKLLSEFGSTKDDNFDQEPYLLPVVPQFAFQVKQALDPIFDYHNVDSFVDVNGIVITSGVSFELIEAIDTAVDNLKKKSLGENDIEWKAAGYRLGRAIGSRLVDRPNIGGGRSRGRFFTSIGAEDFDPFTARDANLNGVVGEGLFLRGVPLATPDPTPDGPGSIRNPKPSPRQLAKPDSEAVARAERAVENVTAPKDRDGLSSGAIPLDLPRIDDPDVDSATKYGAAESQRDELQGVLDGATDSDQIKKLKKAIADLDKYMNNVEKMAEGEMADSEKPKKKPVQKQVTKAGQKLSSGYAKYLDKPSSQRTRDESRKYDGPLASLSSGKLKDKAELPEGSSQLTEMYEEMAKNIVDLLQELIDNPDKAGQWKMPWRNPEMYARNPTRGRIYQGMNQMILSLTGTERGYETSRWAGESQWKKLGGKLKPGARDRGVAILVPREGRTFVDSSGKEVSQGKFYVVQTVFNVADVSGLPEKFYKVEDTDINKEERLQDIENVIQEIGPAFVESKGSQAFYRPLTDKIHMPAFEQFEDALSFYGTAMHETVHWTSHPTRLNRTLGRQFGDEQYAFEELVAEIGSAFAMGTMGLEPTVREDHLLYLNSWLKKLKQDPLALHRAILQAQQANDYLLDRSATMRRLAGIPDGERKGKNSTWYEVPMLAGYEDVESIKPTTNITGTMEDLLDMEEFDDLIPDAPNMSIEEREMRSMEISPNAPSKNKNGVVITPSGALASGKAAGPITGRKKGVPEVERTDEKVSMKFAFGLANEPTNEQRDIMDVAMRLIRTGDPKILSILAGAGTGKTTTLKSISWALQREFELWPEGDKRRDEQLAYLADRYKVDFSKMSVQEVNDAVAKLAQDNPMGNIYYTVFNKKNQLEAELEFPKNTGIATTDKLWFWSLRLGQGDEKYGIKFRRKMEQALTQAENRKAGGLKKNPKFISAEETPDEPEKIGYTYIREKFDGTIETYVGEEPGYRELGWQRLDDAKDWVKFLGIDKWPNQLTQKRRRKIKDDKQRPVMGADGKPQYEEYEVSGFNLPDGTFVTVDEMGDVFKNALGRWDISKEEKAKAWMFTQPDRVLQDMDTARGQGKKPHAVDTVLTETQIPKEWVENLQKAIDAMTETDSNMLPARNSVAKLWMLTNPDLRTDPGLISHADNQKRSDVSVPATLEPGDVYVDKAGTEWIVTGITKDGKGKSNNKASLARRIATKENPLSAFMVDEAQDSNEVLEAVLENNRKNLPIIIVGDDRQAVYAFRNAKNILDSLDPDYALTITESFRYGGIVGHLANLVLGQQNLYLTQQGVPQLPWKHVKGKAQDVVNKVFNPLLPEKDRFGNNPVDEIDDATRALLIADIDKKFSTPDNRLDISSMSRKEQDVALKELRDKIYGPKEGKIVDRVEEADKGNLPTMILARTNAEIINEAMKFINLVVNSEAVERDEFGLPKMPEVIIPVTKWEELLKFTKHLDYIMKTPTKQAEYRKKFGLPDASSWLGPIYNQGDLERILNQSGYQQANTAFKLIMQPPRGGQKGDELGILGMLTLLQGRQVVTQDDKGKDKITLIPPSLLPERKTLELDNFTVGKEEIKTISGYKFVKERDKPEGNTSESYNSQREKIEIIPEPSYAGKKAGDGRQRVYAQLEIQGGSNTSQGKPTGRILITGDGVDTGRAIDNPDGSQAKLKTTNNRQGNGRYRRDLEKIITRLGLQDKVKPEQNAERTIRAGSSRRMYDGFVIEGETLEESAEILNLIGQALRDEAKNVGGDVEITTMQLSKGRESRYVAIAEDLGDPRDSMSLNVPQGQASIGYMEETNLVHVAFSRAKEMIDPGAKGFAFYLHDERTKAVREAMTQAVKDGHIPAEMDKGAFGEDGGIPLPEFYKTLNSTRLEDIDFENLPPRGGKKEEADKPIVITDDMISDEDGPNDFNEVIIDDSYEIEDDLTGETRPTSTGDIDIDDDGQADYGGPEVGTPEVGTRSLSSGATAGSIRRASRRSRKSRVYAGGLSAQQLAGIRIGGNPNSRENREALQFAMQAWDGVRRRGIAIDVDDDTISAEQRQVQTRNAIREVGKAMQIRQNRVRVGNINDNARNENPSAETWMLSVDKLADTIRIPTEFASRGDIGGETSVRWTQSRPASRDEIAKMLGLSPSDAAKLKLDGAGINHDAVRLLIAELGKQENLGAWRYFAPVTAEEALTVTPSPTGDIVENIPQVDLAMENAGRANMRDRFIIETFGKDAFPHWFDTEENQPMTPEEYVQLGEVSEVSKFRATGRFAPDSATKGDSEAEIDLYGESLDLLMPEEGSVTPSGETIRADKTVREDFEIEPLLDYLGIDRKEWKKNLQDRLSAAFGTEDVGINNDWAKDGIPTATVAHMIRTGVLPNAGSIWKDGGTGERFDREISRPKYAVYEALNEFIDKSFPDSKLNSRDTRNKITAATDMGVALRNAAAAKGSVWSPKKGNEARFSGDEMQSMVDRFNAIFGTKYTIEDIFSDEQLRTARERIESGTTLSGKKK